MTAFLGVTSAVMAALTTPPLRTDKGRVVRGRKTPMPAADKWRVLIAGSLQAGTNLDLVGDAIQWDSVVNLDISLRCASDEDAEAAIDPLRSTVWSRLKAMTPPAGVQAITLVARIDTDIDDEADQTLVVDRLSLRVTHITQGASLDA